MASQYWLIKQEPEAYSWKTFEKEGKTAWTGVRNYQARNNLRAMKKGDLALFYHSVSEKQIVGVAKVAKEHFPDATAKEGDWSAVEFVPMKALKSPVSLERIKADPALRGMGLVRQSRLSVTPVSAEHFERVLSLASTPIASR
ncbi:MAG: EVE domain-containing protein [Verrucomicrobia bacterium]|nr:EVE domain-containing protein [Verrucomicrobiota bacterium]MBI3871128.1 EVE domain-containing protein [Verrucomicrobiota bacterium]